MIKLYHGSTVDIEHIDILKSRPNKDFGRGFYLDQFLENLKYMKGVTFQYYFGTERAIAKLTKI